MKSSLGCKLGQFVESDQLLLESYKYPLTKWTHAKQDKEGETNANILKNIYLRKMRATNSYSAHQNTSDKYHLQTQIAVGPIVKKHRKLVPT